MISVGANSPVMPELPETETIARDLQELIVGRRIDGVRVIRKDVLRGPSARALSKVLSGRHVERVWRRAKTVIVGLSGGYHVMVSPRFTGSLQIGEPDEYAAVVYELDDDTLLIYRDVRRLGTVTTVDAQGYAAFDRKLGVEPLTPDFTADALAKILGASSAAVKKTIMDQHRLAGVGNIYAAEALWRARIDPSKEARRVPKDRIEPLRDAIVDVLQAAVDARGTTFRDYRDARNERGQFVKRLQVYGRGGQPCLRCGTYLAETWAIDGRSTVFCFRCQG